MAVSKQPIPASRAASLLLTVGALNLVITLFIALVALKGWNQLPELAVRVRTFDAAGQPVAQVEYKAPREIDDVTDVGAQHVERLPDGSRVELEIPRSSFERVAANANLLKLFQLAIPLSVSVLFLVAGLRARRVGRR
ncbi:MAG: hypothetical protein NTV21_10855 [Planctomycetota bacterium]|nr:hypothetical protein [Planctomycetota bacterium]